MRGLAIACGASILAAMGLSHGDSAAQTAIPCINDGSSNSCVPFYGCIKLSDGSRPIVAAGRTIGVRRGAMSARLSSGAMCNGKWNTRGVGGAVYARCDDGRRFSVFYQSQDPATGVLSGNGTTNRGEPVLGWSGENAPALFKRDAGAPAGTIPCGGAVEIAPVG